VRYCLHEDRHFFPDSSLQTQCDFERLHLDQNTWSGAFLMYARPQTASPTTQLTYNCLFMLLDAFIGKSKCVLRSLGNGSFRHRASTICNCLRNAASPRFSAPHPKPNKVTTTRKTKQNSTRMT
jgi:hypothetical protein